MRYTVKKNLKFCFVKFCFVIKKVEVVQELKKEGMDPWKRKG